MHSEASATWQTEDPKTNLMVVGFTLGDCVVEVEPSLLKYLRPIHRSALELSVHNQFGTEIGGFWLGYDQVDQLRTLVDYYPVSEAPLVASAIEEYLRAQLREFYWAVEENLPG